MSFDVIPIDAVGWIAVALLATAALLHPSRPRAARPVAAAAWVAFAGFWLGLAPEYLFVEKSPLKGILVILGLPLCLHIARTALRNDETGDRVLRLTNAVAVMGLIYLPFTTVPWLHQTLVEAVTLHTLWGVNLLGYQPELVAGPHYGYESALRFTHLNGVTPRTHIELACTGLGSIALLTGLVAVARESAGRRLATVAGIVAIVSLLNWVRNVFIAAAFGDQWLQVGVPYVMAAFSLESEALVSFYLADKVISQLLAATVLVALMLGLLRVLPSLRDFIADVLYLVPLAAAQEMADSLHRRPRSPL